MDRHEILAAELADDPVGRGYAAMDDDQRFATLTIGSASPAALRAAFSSPRRARLRDRKEAAVTQLDTLRTELATDPLGRGYAAMSDAEVLTSLETLDRSRPRTIIPTRMVWAALDLDEVQALATEAAGTQDRARYEHLVALLAMGEIDAQDANTRTSFAKIFTPAKSPKSRQALIDLQDEPISRAEELGIAGFVGLGTIATARA